MHECKSHEEWLTNVHYMCSCGHVEWAHHGANRFFKNRCAHCNCTRYNGELRPLTEHEKQTGYIDVNDIELSRLVEEKRKQLDEIFNRK